MEYFAQAFAWASSDGAAQVGMFRDLNMTGFVAVGDADDQELRALFASRR